MKNIQNKASLVLEYMWIIIALLSLAIAIQNSIQGNWQNAKMFYIFFPVAIIMYLFRRNLRLKKQKENQDDWLDCNFY